MKSLNKTETPIFLSVVCSCFQRQSKNFDVCYNICPVFCLYCLSCLFSIIFVLFVVHFLPSLLFVLLVFCTVRHVCVYFQTICFVCAICTIYHVCFLNYLSCLYLFSILFVLLIFYTIYPVCVYFLYVLSCLFFFILFVLFAFIFYTICLVCCLYYLSCLLSALVVLFVFIFYTFCPACFLYYWSCLFVVFWGFFSILFVLLVGYSVCPMCVNFQYYLSCLLLYCCVWGSYLTLWSPHTPLPPFWNEGADCIVFHWFVACELSFMNDSNTSMTRTPMTRLPWLIQIQFWVPRKFFPLFKNTNI